MSATRRDTAVTDQNRAAIDEVRGEREDLARVLKKHTGIRRVVEDLYPDSAHFIYELLQNAEDTGATEANFILSATGLAFEHNGRPFEKRDIYGITDIGEGTKAEEDDKIGRFGVGFKAVFAYSETPYIWSPTFSFKISDLVLPTAIDAKPNLGAKTRFEFPFNNPKKPLEEAHDDVGKGFFELAETTLLFLSHLQSIGWESNAGSGQVLRIQHSNRHFEVLKEANGKPTSSLHFLKFDKPVVGLEKQRVAVTFALDLLPNVPSFDPKKALAKQFRIVEAEGTVAVYFPAEKETSGLRFHLHGPFVPELSRASIKETPANRPLFDQLGSLAADALEEIRDLGLLTADFLAVLPNRQDQIPDRYKGIRNSVIEAMNTRTLTPTHDKSHAPAKDLLQARATLKDLLSEEDLEYLVDYNEDPPRWAVAATQRNTNVDRFLASLAIKDWGIDKFALLLTNKTGRGGRRIAAPPYYAHGPDAEFVGWLSKKPVEWHQQLYALLYSELAPAGTLHRFKDANIVRLGDGQYSTSDKCYFPDGGGKGDDALPRVDAAIYNSGRAKTQQQNAQKFLEEIGVRVVGEAEQVEVILNQRYTKDAKIPDEKTNLRDLKRFVVLVEKEPQRATLFADYYIFEASDGKHWCKPGQLYLDNPFLDTDLTAYYEAIGEDAGAFSLAERYRDCGIPLKMMAAFAKAVGAKAELPIEHTSCYGNPQRQYLWAVGGERSTSPIDRDYTIEGLESLLKAPSLDLSRLLWRTMCALPGDGRYLQAIYRRNVSAGARSVDSQLIQHLQKVAWVPQGGGSFVRPDEASRDSLPKGFPFDPGQAWLTAVRFGEAVTRRSVEQRQKQAVAKELGFSDEGSLERARRFTALPPEEQERILVDQERRAAVFLPEDIPANPMRRGEAVAARAAVAPDKITEERTRSVSIGREAVKEETAQYLRQQYTSDGDVICQVCKAPMPFKLEDGTDYFEKVEFLPKLRKRHFQNYLALCPNHAAMFKEANGSAEEMGDLFVALAGNELEVTLAQEDATIYFTKKHIFDLRKVLENDDATPVAVEPSESPLS
jgi:hypothetical protein